MGKNRYLMDSTYVHELLDSYGIELELENLYISLLKVRIPEFEVYEYLKWRERTEATIRIQTNTSSVLLGLLKSNGSRIR